MQTFDQLLAVKKCFTLEHICKLRPKLGNALETWYLDEVYQEKKDDDEHVPIVEDLQVTNRRYTELQTILHAHEGDIAWLYDQVEKIRFEAEAANS